MIYKTIIIILLKGIVFANIVQFGGGLFVDSQNAKDLGMGGYSVSMASGANPTLLINANKSELHFSYKDKFHGLSRVKTISYLHCKLEDEIKSPIFVSIVKRSVSDIPDTRRALESGNYPEPSNINYLNISNISHNELGLKVSLLRQYNLFLLGFSFKAIYNKLAEYKALGFSADVGGAITVSDNINFSIRMMDALSYKKWNTDSHEINTPIIIVGSKFTFTTLLFGFEIKTPISNTNLIDYNAGIEYYLKDRFVILRAGISRNLLFSVGIGLDLKSLFLDYAYLQTSPVMPFNASQIFSIGFPIESLYQIKEKIIP